MAQKKRRFEQLQAAAATPAVKKTYVDPFQQRVVPHLESFGEKVEGKGRTILYAITAAAILGVIVWFVTSYIRNTGAEAQTALGKAIETSSARVSETGPMAGSTERTFKTEKERAEASIAEFPIVVDNYGGAVAEKARYFIAVNRLSLDRPAGIQELEALANSSSEAGTMSKYALAQTRISDNRFDEAAVLLQELAAMSNPIVAKDTINFELAGVYEKQGKKQEAADLYYNIVKAASEAKDINDKPRRMSETATQARARLKELDPERERSLPDAGDPQAVSADGGTIMM
jgi:tetratricopeptide (TPR) repeat protein